MEEPTFKDAVIVAIGFILLGIVLFGACDQRGEGGRADDQCVGSQVFC